MNKEEIIKNYVGYVENLIYEGEKFESLEEAVNYAFSMYQEDSKLWKDSRHHRFIGNKFIKEELRRELTNLLKE